jgi:ABC-type cobalt transport system, permease component CbiQ and related transporters
MDGPADTAAGLAAAAALVWPVRRLLRPYRGVIVYYLALTAALALIAGTRFTPAFSWDSGAALNTAWLMLRLLAVMLLGMPLLALITPYRLQQAVERLLAALRLPQRNVWAVGLSVSLLFRFIPLMAAEWNRFARIGVARGKHPVPPGRIPVRALPAVLVPFLLAMLQTADRVAVSLTLRGFDSGRRAAERARPIRFTRRDAAFIAGSAAVFALLRLIDMAL